MNSISTDKKIYLSVILSRILRYIEVGWLLHFIAFLALLLSIYFYNLTLESYIHNNEVEIYLYGYIFIHLFTIPFFAELDARSRYQNYKFIRDLIFQYGFRERFIKTLIHSKCQREAAYFAAKDLSYEDEIVFFFRRSGYRWYDIFPDFLWYNPGYLLTKHFWATTFFAKTYDSKYFK